MNAPLDSTVDHLRRLVAHDTQNPPRDISPTGIFGYLRDQLPDFEHTLVDLGDGCISLLARRGRNADVLFNFHVDTVPATDDWSGAPFELYVDERRAVGLGACDIKGASACMLTAAARTDGDLALLFTSDEEAGSSRCVRTYLDTLEQDAYEGVVVAEPTGAKAICAHRGIATATGHFSGTAGHGSEARALQDNALHHAAGWAARAVDFARDHEAQSWEELSGIRFNLGTLEGGIKPNMIAPSATLRFGVRPRPDQDGHELLRELFSLADADNDALWEPGFLAPSLPADGDLDKNAALAARLDLETGEPVDFWTEAALFSRAGYPTIVYGPGDIARAHTADEWVALRQLQIVTDTYIRLIDN